MLASKLYKSFHRVLPTSMSKGMWKKSLAYVKFTGRCGLAGLGTSQLYCNEVLEQTQAPLKEPFLAVESKSHPDLQAMDASLNFQPLNAVVIFILGGPGVGKGGWNFTLGFFSLGTQCTKLIQKYGFVHISAGDLLREEQNRPNSLYSNLINEYLKEGKIVPFKITISLLKTKMAQYGQNTVFLIDGFPREIQQGWEFETHVSKALLVLAYDCSQEVMLQRILERSKKSNRVDDNVDSIIKRFETFQRLTRPVIKWYETFGLVQKISCEGTPEMVFEQTDSIIQNFMKQHNIVLKNCPTSSTQK